MLKELTSFERGLVYTVLLGLVVLFVAFVIYCIVLMVESFLDSFSPKISRANKFGQDVKFIKQQTIENGNKLYVLERELNKRGDSL